MLKGPSLRTATLAFTALISLFVASTAAQTEKIIHAFNFDSDGFEPSSALTTDSAGNFYGTTLGGGAHGDGAVYELSPNGDGTWSESLIYSFSGSDGSSPHGNLVMDANGNLYGTTISGGTNSSGTIYRLMPSQNTWNEQVLYSFVGGSDGAFPYAGVILDAGGNLYGTTTFGGGSSNCIQSNPSYNGCGTVFEFDTTEHEYILHSFAWDTDGAYPYGGVIFDAVGNVYGTTSGGGIVDGNPDSCDSGQVQINESGCGTAFKLTPNGNGWKEQVLYYFGSNYQYSGGDGILPQASLVFDKAGNLYGTTTAGGTGSFYGTIFLLSPSGENWTESILYNFMGGTDGSQPQDSLILDASGNLYGTTSGFGIDGSVFELLPSSGNWTLKVLYDFMGGADGSGPQTNLIFDGSGNLYGTTYAGGGGFCYNGCGTAFEIINGKQTPTTTSLSPSLNPSTYGQSVTFASQVLPATGSGTPTGDVTFSESGDTLAVAPLSGGVAALPIWTLPAGLNPIIASYGGDANYAPSVSPVLNQQVNQATSVAVLASSPNPSTANQPVTLKATVTGPYGGTPTGSVTFQQGNTILGIAPLLIGQGTLTYTFTTPGTFTITAAYSGDTNFIANTSGPLVQTVKAALSQVGLPVLFVHGFCDLPQSFQIAESDVQTFLQKTYPQFYGDVSQYWVFYDSKNVNFEIPNGTRTYRSVPATSRFFAVAFEDPRHPPLVQQFDTSEVAKVSINAKADELAHIIWKIKSITGMPRVIVVAHSMGGLVSRAYIEELGSGSSPDPYLNDISTLVTLDTPHGGAALARLLQYINLGTCYAEPSLDSRQMEPTGPDSIIPQLNYVVSGATTLPVALTAYSIQSYWTISTPLGQIDPLDKGTDNVLYAYIPLGFPSEQDLYSNLNNPTQNSKSNLFKVNNPFNALFDLCGSLHVPPYVLHFLSCTGSASQTFGLVEKEIQIPAVMTRAVTITPSSATIALGGNVQMVAKTPSNQATIWSLLEGPAAGSITQGGLYTTGSVTGTFHVVAIDSVKSNDYGIATITVTP